nr:unnamed protein product [Papilio xuthus]
MNNQNFENTSNKINVEKSKSKRQFQKIWTKRFCVIEHEEKVLCILCNDFVVSRFYNIERHFKTIHKDISLKSFEEKDEQISLQLKRFKNEDFTLYKYLKGFTNINLTSYVIAKSIAERGRPLSYGEFIKQTFLECAPNLFQDMDICAKIIRRIENLPLSINTIKERIIEMSTNVSQQLNADLISCEYYSLSLEETTDATSNARLAIIARYSDGQTMREELVKLATLPLKTTGSEICRIVSETFDELNIDVSKIVSITTDGAQNMVGKIMGLRGCLLIKLAIQ